MNKLNQISLNFIISKERTGSSLLTALLNKHPQILATSEEPFLLYFYRSYKNKVFKTKKDVEAFYEKFWLMHEKSLTLYFSSKQEAIDNTVKLIQENPNSNFIDFCKAVYLQFLPQKDKSKVTTIIDKQLKYSFHLPQIVNYVPKAKYIFLVREPKANIYSCINRKIGKNNISYQAEIWNLYTKGIIQFQDKLNSITITYEELILETEKTLNKITTFLNVSGIENFEGHQTDFDQLIESKANKLDDQFIKQLKEFHSGLLSPIDSSKITEFQKHFSETEYKKIEYITTNNAKYFGYNTSSFKLSLSDRINILLARINKKWLLKFYFYIPFKLKLFIKKIRRKNIDA